MNEKVEQHDHHPQRRPVATVRAEVIERLKHNYAYDTIDDRELSLRLEQAEAATSTAELELIVADLPAVVEPETETVTAKVNRGEVAVEQTATLLAVMGGTERRGAWRPARKTKAVAVMGGIDLDYRDAVFPPGKTTLTIVCLMGGVEIVVPPGVAVELSGLPILGGVENRTDHPNNPSAPVLEVKALVVMGGVDIKTKQSKLRKGTQ